MTAVWNVDAHDINYYLRDIGVTLPETATLEVVGPGMDGHEEALRAAFSFLRRHDDGRYSSRMKMRVLQAAEDAERGRELGVSHTSYPGVVMVRVPTHYNEDTEVKGGGLLAAGVCWSGEDGKVVLATHVDHRRKGLGKTIMHTLQNACGIYTRTAWVNKSNIIGQHFLLAVGLTPTGFNASGGVCYTGTVGSSRETTDGVEDYLDPLETGPRPRRLDAEPSYQSPFHEDDDRYERDYDDDE